MNIEQLIAGLKSYKGNLPVMFALPGEQGRSAQHFEIDSFDVHFPPVPIGKEAGSWRPDYVILKPKL